MERDTACSPLTREFRLPVFAMKFLLPLMMFVSLSGSPAMAQPAAGVAMDPAGARRWLEDYVRIWSSDRAVNADTVNTYYAPVVTYYGKRMTRRQVLDDKRRYIRTYPGRMYEIVEGSVAVGCDGARTLCTTSGVMRVHLTDRAGRTLMRTARLRLAISATGGGQIIGESAVDIPAPGKTSGLGRL